VIANISQGLALGHRTVSCMNGFLVESLELIFLQQKQSISLSEFLIRHFWYWRLLGAGFTFALVEDSRRGSFFIGLSLHFNLLFCIFGFI